MEQDESDRKIKQDFIREALEMLSGVEDQFLLFEQNPGDSKVVDKIFRIAHTVKASAMTCGFKRLGEFAHLMETLLVMIREGQHIPDSETVDVFLRANDTLRAYLDLLRNDFDAVLNTDLIKEDLMHFIGHEVKSTSAVLMSGFGCFHDEAATAPSSAFGFFEDEAPAVVMAPVEFPKAVVRPTLTSETVSSPFEELSYLSLKAYLELSNDPSPLGVEACLKTLENVLSQLSTIREN